MQWRISKTLRESAERKEQEYQAAVQRAADHALIAEKHKKDFWKARRELDKNKNAGSCPSTSEAEHMSVASPDDGLAASGLDDEEMRQNYLEDVLDAAPSQSPPNKVKASSSSGRPNRDTSQVASSALLVLDVSKCQNEEQAMLTVQSRPMDAVGTIMRLCLERRRRAEEEFKGVARVRVWLGSRRTPVTMDGLSLGKKPKKSKDRLSSVEGFARFGLQGAGKE